MLLLTKAKTKYFGTMAGVRGFADPNVQINPANNLSIWYQPVSTLTTKADYLLPYWLNYENTEEGHNKSQCLCAGANNWVPTHNAMNKGANDQWAVIDDPQSWGYHKRQDTSYHFALAESYTLADMYHVSSSSKQAPGPPNVLFPGIVRHEVGWLTPRRRPSCPTRTPTAGTGNPARSTSPAARLLSARAVSFWTTTRATVSPSPP